MALHSFITPFLFFAPESELTGFTNDFHYVLQEPNQPDHPHGLFVLIGFLF